MIQSDEGSIYLLEYFSYIDERENDFDNFFDDRPISSKNSCWTHMVLDPYQG